MGAPARIAVRDLNLHDIGKRVSITTHIGSEKQLTATVEGKLFRIEIVRYKVILGLASMGVDIELPTAFVTVENYEVDPESYVGVGI